MSPAVERPAPAQDPQDLAERRRAARALLLTPLLTATGQHGDEFVLVRRHQGELTRMFAEGLGYRLQVDPAAARLFKSGLGRDPSRPLRRRSGTAFTPRGYALLCLTVAALTRSRSQLLVDELVAQVRSAAVDAEVEIDLDAVGDRRALHAALMVLVSLGVLHERDGDLEHWADQRTQSLLDVRRDLLTLLVAAPLASAQGPDDLLEQASVPSAAGGARSAIRRRLVESPVLSVADLTDDQAEWWRRNRNRERDWYVDRFGLELELRAEGAVAVDPDDELGDELFPGRDKTRQLALLLLERLVAEVRDRPGHPLGAEPVDDGPDPSLGPWSAVPTERAQAIGLEMVASLRDRLRRDQRDQPEAAVIDALGVLERFGLVRCAAASVAVHAAGARYAPRLAWGEAATTGERSLFRLDDDEGNG